jgi:hypothetical protein
MYKNRASGKVAIVHATHIASIVDLPEPGDTLISSLWFGISSLHAEDKALAMII